MLENGFTGIDPGTLQSKVTRYFLGNEILLFAHETLQLYYLNTTAAVIWCCCEERQSVDQIVSTLVDSFDTDPEKARRDIDSVLQEWANHGLLVDNHSRQPCEPQISAHTSIAVEPALNRQPADRKFISEHYFKLLDSCFRIRGDSSYTANMIHSNLQQLSLDYKASDFVKFDLIEKHAGYELYANNSFRASCDTRAGLLPLVHSQMLLHAYQHAPCLFALHSAAIVKGDVCVLLPGSPGSGKSTLTAALISQGWKYYTDEICLLDSGSFSVRPAPASIGLKSGSWQALQPFYPDLMNLPEWRRIDNQRIRYLPPPPDSQPEDIINDRSVVTHVVFPCYDSNSKLNLQPVGSAEAICRIAEAGYDTQAGLSVAKVDQMVDWIQSIRCFEMEFSDLADATRTLERLTANET